MHAFKILEAIALVILYALQLTVSFYVFRQTRKNNFRPVMIVGLIVIIGLLVMRALASAQSPTPTPTVTPTATMTAVTLGTLCQASPNDRNLIIFPVGHVAMFTLVSLTGNPLPATMQFNINQQLRTFSLSGPVSIGTLNDASTRWDITVAQAGYTSNELTIYVE
jgi:hypothetical protein